MSLQITYISLWTVPNDNYQPTNVYQIPITISGINSAALLAAMNKLNPLYIWAVYPKENIPIKLVTDRYNLRV